MSKQRGLIKKWRPFCNTMSIINKMIGQNGQLLQEFQYNDKKYAAMVQTLFKLNFGRHPQKGNLVAQMEFLKLEKFFIELQRSWEEATKSMEVAQKNMKQFNKK